MDTVVRIKVSTFNLLCSLSAKLEQHLPYSYIPTPSPETVTSTAAADEPHQDSVCCHENKNQYLYKITDYRGVKALSSATQPSLDAHKHKNPGKDQI